MKYMIFVLTFCLMAMLPQESFAVLAPAKENPTAYEEMTRAEKKTFRKDLRKRIKAAKKTPPRGNFENAWAAGISLASVGLVGIIVGAVLRLPLIYSLGGLFLTIGLVIMLLYWLDVI